MNFAWDEGKSERNRRERNLPFTIAPAIFAGRRLEWCDVRQDYGEIRVCALGEIAGRVHFVAYTIRGNLTWILSFRKANRRETRAYREVYPG